MTHFRKLIWLLVVFLALPLGVCLAQPPAVVRESIVGVAIKDTARGISNGSGVLAAKDATHGYILSCGHLFREGFSGGFVSFPNGDLYQVEAYHYDPTLDLSVMRINVPGQNAVRLATRRPAVGEVLTAAGYDQNGRYLQVSGVVDNYESPSGAPADVDGAFAIRGRVPSGASGGPMFNEAGELVGVLWGSSDEVSALHIETIWQFLVDAPRSVIGNAFGDRQIPSPDADWAATIQPRNFVVTGGTPEQNEQVRAAAERYRQELAIEWIGKAFPDWSAPASIRIVPYGTLSAETSFQFLNGEVFGWRGTWRGEPERLLDSVVPHEVLHMVFASHFRQQLPRWADEGAAATLEHNSQQALLRERLVRNLKTGKGIPTSALLVSMDYPADSVAMVDMYAQSHSLVSFLLELGGQREFVEFMGDGLDSGWEAAVAAHYGVQSLASLQDDWLVWLKGEPAADRRSTVEAPLVPVRQATPAIETVSIPVEVDGEHTVFQIALSSGQVCNVDLSAWFEAVNRMGQINNEQNETLQWLLDNHKTIQASLSVLQTTVNNIDVTAENTTDLTAVNEQLARLQSQIDAIHVPTVDEIQAGLDPIGFGRTDGSGNLLITPVEVRLGEWLDMRTFFKPPDLTTGQSP